MVGLFENLLTFIFKIIGNYGWAVIIFSLLIKAVLLPLDIKSRRSMKAMSALSPKMEELKKRYANDQEKLNQKMGELYKKNKVNPLSGCLPLLLQLPILFIMFAAMRNIAAELQLSQMFGWVKDNFVDGDKWTLLSTSLADWNAIRETMLLGKSLSGEQSRIVELFLQNSQLLNITAEDAKTLIDSFATAEVNAGIWDQLVTWTRDWSTVRGLILDGGELSYEQLELVNVFLKSDNGEVLAFLEGLKNGVGAEVFNENSWLWVKNVFQPDSFSKTTVLTQSELQTMLSQYAKKIGDKDMLALLKMYAANIGTSFAPSVDAAIAEHCNYWSANLFFTMLPIKIPRDWSVYVNGCLILPILAGVSQFVQTKLTPSTENANQNSGKFMKWFFPIFSVWICLSSTAAFAAYWVFVNLWSIVTTYFINKSLNKSFTAVSENEKEAIQP